MKATMILPLLGLVSVIGSSACATVVRTPVYEPVYTPVYAPARTVVVERDAPYYSPAVYHTTYVTRSAPSVVYVHSRGRPDDCDDQGGSYVAHNGGGYGHDHGNTVVVVNNEGRGGHDNGRGNNYSNNGHGNGDNHGRGNGHSRGRG
jgi:hypothetical protein